MPSLLIFYQYFHPDEVVSSVHWTELATGLAQRGWTVTAMPSNRSCRNEAVCHVSRSEYSGVAIRRVWRPAFKQRSNAGRLANAFWMIGAWSLSSVLQRPDVVLVGTDPVLSILTALPWKALNRRAKLVHWCFDLYPEAAVADGILKQGFVLSILRRLVSAAYRRFDLLADIGNCMRQRLEVYKSPARRATLTPWALAEPKAPLAVDTIARRSAFGDAPLLLMYSGSFGRSHSFAEILHIARNMRHVDAHFAFSIAGNRADAVRKAVREDDRNISFLPFASPDQLESRLSMADIHIVSLRSDWTGTVVPSKFFGAIASGRPVLFVGDEGSYIAETIRTFGLGWVCTPGNEQPVIEALVEIARNPETLKLMGAHCHCVYQAHFSKEAVLDRFDEEIRTLAGEERQDAAKLAGTPVQI